MKEGRTEGMFGLLDGWNDGWNDGWTVFSEESWLEARLGGKATMTKKKVSTGPNMFFSQPTTKLADAGMQHTAEC